ncbi:gamma-glutamyltransferase [Alkaliphilus metalliredigens QYMF]|uniref:Glutathione hydrolase proenzyme n=1 Tax=Alkaliphilus metalliredigens (strain QYMF) TaxID=293826 RepID=A6TUJ6_ALKMQ|nr:gamma-glutamyltransferase [Alkaliphilus metalliredigens]ABR49864.1 gamma-glutamyltransferase [Alkaliphilus metalliredigens QYMF]
MKSSERKISSSESPLGMVSTASKQATEAGVKILKKGGNAIDAAVASAFCIGVTEPQASGLGGQSMVLVYLEEGKRVFALDGSSRAPFGIQPHKTPKTAIKTGLKSTTVPSTPATLGYMHEKYGKLSLATVMEPAILAAEEGFVVSQLQYELMSKHAELLRQDPLILKNYFKDHEPIEVGGIIRQPELAKCLIRMAEAGWHDFYIGSIGNKIVQDMEKRDGLISFTDLSQIPQPVEREVLTSSYRDYEIHTFPPPGAGRVLVQLLNILENFPPDMLNTADPAGATIFALAFRMALTDRQRMPMHPDYYLQTVNKMMTDKTYAQELSDRIHQIGKFSFPELFKPPITSGETTHLSVSDNEGNSVGITQSIELVFGSKTMADGLGFFYNNYMSAFDYKNMAHPFYLLPGGKPWSSVAPTLLFHQGKPKYLLGSPGSERISTTLAQVISRLVDGGMDLPSAIAAPRFHSSHAGVLQIEKSRFDPKVLETLEQTGFSIKNRGAYSFYLGCVQGISIPQGQGELFCGVADPRRDGTAKGPKYLSNNRGRLV